MLFAKIDKDKKILEYPLSEKAVRLALTNVSLPKDLSNFDLIDFGYAKVDAVQPPKAVDELSRIILDTPVWKKGSLKRTFKEEKIDDKIIDNSWRKIRLERSRRLLVTDWTQGNDCSLSADKIAEYKEYRQALRDITKQTNPFRIVWPKKPD